MKTSCEAKQLNYVKPSAKTDGFSLFLHKIHRFLHKNVLFTNCSFFFQNSFKHFPPVYAILYLQARSNLKNSFFSLLSLNADSAAWLEGQTADDAKLPYRKVCLAALPRAVFFCPVIKMQAVPISELPAFFIDYISHKTCCIIASPAMISSFVMVSGGISHSVFSPAVSTKSPASISFCANFLWSVP